MKVLIVDDDAYAVNGLKRMIAWDKLGINEVMTAKDGEEGWQLFQKHPLDLLITDVYMPRMNGLELIKRIRSVNADIPIIILSGYDEFNYAKEAIQLDVAQYILKPAVFTEIERVLKEVVSEKFVADKKEQYLCGLRSHLEQSVPILREQFLFDMLSAALMERDITGHRTQFLDLDEQVFDGGLVMSLMIYRDWNHKTESERDWQLYKFGAYNIAQEIVQAKGSCYLLRYMEDRLPLLLYGPKEETLQRAKSIAAEFIESVGAYLELNANAGIGRWYGRFTAYPISHKESRDMLAMVEYEGYQQIFDAEEKREQSGGTWHAYPFEYVRQLTEALFHMDHEKVMQHWAEIESMLLDGTGGSLKYLKTLCISMVNNLVLYGMKEDPSTLELGQLAQFLQDIQSAPSQQLLMERVRTILSQLLETLERKYRSGKQNAYVQHVKRAVAKQYKENISFARIADELHVTRNYLSSLFKSETGESFTNYLTLYRIERAKELMKLGRYMIYEISEMVGYSDPAYFSRVFKNVAGMNPTEYALEHWNG